MKNEPAKPIALMADLQKKFLYVAQSGYYIKSEI